MAAQDPFRIFTRPAGPALLALALVACQSTKGSNAPSDLPPVLAQQPSQDRSVEASLEQIIRDSRLVDGLRVVELELQNRASESVAFAYSVEWLDRAGHKLADPEAGWTPLVLAAGDSRRIELRAPSPEADSWRLMAAALPPG